MNEIVTNIRCDECGRQTTGAHRIYKEHRYCGTCYARVFKRLMCPKCGNFARLPKTDANAVCRKCEINKPCVRCGKDKYQIGKISPYGPVCNSCAPYFREMQPCGICGQLSQRLSRVTKLGIEVPVCQKCARPEHANCPACRRHRILFTAPDGRQLCKACLEHGEIKCPACNDDMPAGRGKLCETCYWRNTFKKRLKMDQAAISTSKMQAAFEEFGEWLLIEVGGKKAGLTIHRYMPFFVEIEKYWGSIPGYTELLERFGAEGLRRVRLPMRWLNEHKYVVTNSEAREDNSEQRRIDELVSSFPQGTPAEKILTAYQNRLMKRVNAEKSTLRSVRLALRPAVSLQLLSDPSGLTMPHQLSLDQYLLKAPGQKAAITGFINFLNEAHGLNLLSKVDEKLVNEASRKKLEVELMTLIREGGEGENFKQRWLILALSYFHRIPGKIGRSLERKQITTHDDGSATIHLNDKKYWIPAIAIIALPLMNNSVLVDNALDQ